MFKTVKYIPWRSKNTSSTVPLFKFLEIRHLETETDRQTDILCQEERQTEITAI